MSKNETEKVLVVIDIQKEYNTSGRPFCIRNIDQSLIQAKRVLTFARSNKWTIVHVRHLQDGSIFNTTDRHAQFIEGFESLGNELEVHKGNFSCFSSAKFVQLIEEKRNNEIVVIGYNSTMCIPSTIIDGYHRGFNMVFVRDASAAKKTSRFDESSTHEYMVDVLSTFSKVLTADDLLNRL